VTRSQPEDNLDIRHQADIPSTCFEMTMTMKHDRLDRPYLYVAGKEGGLKIYDISTLTSPQLVKTIPITSLDGLDVMNLEQSGNHLFLALGNHFTNSRSPGMAIVDVSTPASAFVTDTWKHDAPDGGGGIVKVAGDYAYLGAMKHGLIILDISDVENITYISRIVPDINYPTPNPNPDLYNARGMEVRDDVVYLCYDAGGLRIINVRDKSKPVETGRYSNPVMNGRPRAYNNIVLDGSLAYITVDYCGLEVLDISDTANLTLDGWWNPLGCPDNNWFASPVHTNEIEIDRNCRRLFISTGKSDLYVLSIADPASPDSIGGYGGVENNLGTWGVSVHEELIFLSYICAVIPFGSQWTGVKILSHDNICTSEIVDRGEARGIIITPPAGDRIEVRLPEGINSPDAAEIVIADILGRPHSPEVVESSGSRIILDMSSLPDGFYILSLRLGETRYVEEFIRR
jgi:hypothetical protein